MTGDIKIARPLTDKIICPCADDKPLIWHNGRSLDHNARNSNSIRAPVCHIHLHNKRHQNWFTTKNGGEKNLSMLKCIENKRTAYEFGNLKKISPSC